MSNTNIIGDFLNTSIKVSKEVIPINATDSKDYFENWTKQKVAVHVTMPQNVYECRILNIVSVGNAGILIVERELRGRLVHSLIPLNSVYLIEPVV